MRYAVLIAVASIVGAAGLPAERCDAGVQVSSRTSEPSDSARPAPAARALRVVVTIPPLRGLVEPLLPKGSTVEVLIPPGASEHGYEIPPAKLAAAASADLVVSIGLGLEPQVDKLLKEKPRSGRTEVRAAAALGVEKAGQEDHAGHDHVHDETCDHGHAGDPHVWLDPVMARALVVHITGVLTKMGAAPSASAVAELVARIDRVDGRYAATLKDAPRRVLVVAHDAYGHMAERYKLEVVPLAGLHAGEPKPADIKRAVEVMRAKGVTTVFVEPQLNKGAAERLAAAVGAKVAVLDPLGDGDWFGLMERNLGAIAGSLGVVVREAEPVKPRAADPVETRSGGGG